jgi:hypothetical protein
MTKDQIRIAIATELGLQSKYQITAPTGDKVWGPKTPNYPESLDACREFELTLELGHDGSDVAEYQEALWCAANPYIPFSATSLHDVAYLRNLICATALQRCEAFLRLKGKWVEDAE